MFSVTFFKKRRVLLLLVLLLAGQAFGRSPLLKFNDGGEFKILQLTDLHLYDRVADTVFSTVREMVETERPDLIVLTGDISFKYKDSAFVLIKRLAGILAENKRPWAVVFGNHDEECGYTRAFLSKMYRSLPYNCNGYTPGIRGETNFALPIAGKKSRHAGVLYFFDSNAYNKDKDKRLGKFDWIDFTQIDWYRKTSTAYTKKNAGTPIPSLAYFHIPIPEYETVWSDTNSTCVGKRNQPASTPLYNTGLYAAMQQCGDIMGTFVGHDHDNDYIGCYNGIALGYGQFSGPGSLGKLIPGARIVVLLEGKREFYTWIREKGGKIRFKCHYPHNYLQAPRE